MGPFNRRRMDALDSGELRLRTEEHLQRRYALSRSAQPLRRDRPAGPFVQNSSRTALHRRGSWPVCRWHRRRWFGKPARIRTRRRNVDRAEQNSGQLDPSHVVAGSERNRRHEERQVFLLRVPYCAWKPNMPICRLTLASPQHPW